KQARTLFDRKFSNPTDAIMKDRFIEEHYLSYLPPAQPLGRVAEICSSVQLLQSPNRVPVIMDDLTHWHEVIQWRQHLFHEVHRTVSSSFCSRQSYAGKNHLKMIALHSFVTAMIQFAKVARKHHLRTFWEAVEFMEKTSIKFFNAMEKAEFFSYKGVFFAMLNKGDEANKNFSMAIQLNDTVYRVWMHYGDFLEHDAPSRRDQNAILNGTYAIQCFMEAAKAQSDFDDATGSLAKCFEERTANVQPSHFLAWINNLLVALLGVEGKHIVSLLIAISRQFPVPLYLPVRQLCVGCSIPPFSAAAAAADTDSSDMPIPTEVSALLTEMLKRLWRSGRDPELQPATGSLQSAIRCLSRKWLPTIESRARRLPRAFLLADRAPPLANFCCASSRRPVGRVGAARRTIGRQAGVQHWVKVHSVLPSVRVLLRNGCAVRCVQCAAPTARVYSYLLEQDSASVRASPVIACSQLCHPRRPPWPRGAKPRVGHLTRLINWILAKEKEPARRLLAGRCAQMRRFGRGHRLTRTPAGLSASSMPTRAANPAPEPDRPLLLSCRLANLLEELIGDVGPDLLLKRCLAELAARASKSASSSVAATAGSFASQAADSQPPTRLPFRLTPNLCELISPLGIRGPSPGRHHRQRPLLSAAQIPAGRLYLRCVLRDEANGGACPEADALTQSVGQAVSAILARLQALARIRGGGKASCRT
uniref:TPR_REGION domain-containing protein n=1 Tax=Macrostomum lignano TaxID=282301 RepID=A0A1I8F930_9PLAT